MDKQSKEATATSKPKEMNGQPVVWAGPKDKYEAFLAVRNLVDATIKAGMFGSIDEVVKLKQCLNYLDPGPEKE